jgi:hypothetical protein
MVFRRGSLGVSLCLGSLLLGVLLGVTVTADAAQAASVSGCSPNFSAGAEISGAAETSDGGGYWEVDQYGDVAALGTALCFGSMTGMGLVAPIVGIAGTADGRGYWLVASDGGVFSFGDATYEGRAEVIPECSINQLALTLEDASRGGNQVVLPGVLTNLSTAACTMSGTPDVTLTASAGQAIATHELSVQPSPPVVVNPGDQASFSVIYSDTDGTTDQTCQPTAQGLTVSLSGQNGSLAANTAVGGIPLDPCEGDISVTGFSLASDRA